MTRRILRLLCLCLLASPGASCAWMRPKPPEYPAVHLESGLVVHDLVVPEEGEGAAPGDEVELDYVMRLSDGSVIDSSLQTGQKLRFRIGDGQVPAGLDEGVVGMRLFGRRELIVPPALGYGEEGVPPRIPPNATLRFEIELMALLSSVTP